MAAGARACHDRGKKSNGVGIDCQKDVIDLGIEPRTYAVLRRRHNQLDQSTVVIVVEMLPWRTTLLGKDFMAPSSRSGPLFVASFSYILRVATLN